uniref:Pyroglutamyl-peptidase I n=1 Tax=Euplotes harpa TaxID=151035 RepID=A0A7S3JPB9_9SPIT|mmetsp:Transcript_817/g.769  ORF Transcript_817/g.769 Transcript_817/m.769 type:complete len:145 (+) Transcript_817:175-609(+)
MQDHIYDGSRNLVLHLGTDFSASRVCIEKQAKNLMDFQLPDNEGNQPKGKKIDKEKKPDHILVCKINTSAVCAGLREKQHNCAESQDAGGYICNYIYYSSMMTMAYVDNADVVFIHVPSFATIRKEKQLACVLEFLKKWILMEI